MEPPPAVSNSGGRNRIIANALLNIGNGELADLGGSHILGPAPGTVGADNLISEVRRYRELGAGAWGIYNDEGSSDLRVENTMPSKHQIDKEATSQTHKIEKSTRCA